MRLVGWVGLSVYLFLKKSGRDEVVFALLAGRLGARPRWRFVYCVRILGVCLRLLVDMFVFEGLSVVKKQMWMS